MAGDQYSRDFFEGDSLNFACFQSEIYNFWLSIKFNVNSLPYGIKYSIHPSSDAVIWSRTTTPHNSSLLSKSCIHIYTYCSEYDISPCLADIYYIIQQLILFGARMLTISLFILVVLDYIQISTLMKCALEK